MAIRLLAAAALLLVPAGALGTQVFLRAARGGPASSASEPGAPSAEAWPIEAPTRMRAWLDQAAKANEELDEEARTFIQELADTARKEADPMTRKEQELQMLEAMLKDWGTENESGISDISRRMAAIAFRRAIRNHIRRPAKADRRRRKLAQDPTPEQVLDSEIYDDLNTWGYEADEPTPDTEKHVRTEGSDLGEAAPKNEEERTRDLMDGTSPEDGTEMSVAQERIAADARMAEARRAWVKEAQAQAFADVAGALMAQGERTAVHPPSQRMPEVCSKMVEAITAWMAEAIEASHELEKTTSYEESDFGEAKLKGEEEHYLERVADLIDEVESKSAPEVADRADALAQVERRPKRQSVGRSHQIASADMDSEMVGAMRIWMAEAMTTCQDVERASKDVRHGESDHEGGKPRGEDQNLTVADLPDEVDPTNASEIAVVADAGARTQRRSMRTASRHESQDLRSWVTKALDAMRSAGRHDEDRVVESMMRQPRGGHSDTHARLVVAMRGWMAEAAKASRDLEKDAHYEESNLGEAVPKGQEEKGVKRVEHLNDEVDPEATSELEELAAAIAQARALRSKIRRRHRPEGGAKENTKRVKPALPTSAPDRAAPRANHALEAERGAPVVEAAAKQLKMLEELWKKYGSGSRPAAAGGAAEGRDGDAAAAS